MISGTTGLLGCADGAFLLQKERGTSLNATLDIVGRDQGEQKLYLVRDRERLICDCLKYEGKLEHEIFKEALQSYIKDEEKDISMLMEYARARKVVSKVQSLIGVWL